MNRNQKIALGCGGAGCLGLIVVAIAGGLIYYFMRSPYYRSDNSNVSTNRNSNSNDNSDFTTNRNSNDNDNSSNTNSSSTSASSMSDDDKHKLYQAAVMTADQELIRRVTVKLGLTNEDFTPSGDEYEKFLADHVGWLIRNSSFIQSINTPDKARAYVNENFPE
jgi:uncharacterized protein involved in exopolysaccharide biosynthesis